MSLSVGWVPQQQVGFPPKTTHLLVLLFPEILPQIVFIYHYWHLQHNQPFTLTNACLLTEQENIEAFFFLYFGKMSLLTGA